MLVNQIDSKERKIKKNKTLLFFYVCRMLGGIKTSLFLPFAQMNASEREDEEALLCVSFLEPKNTQ